MGTGVIFRCDATKETGLGHLSRCLGLAEALRDTGCSSHFAGHYAPEFAAWICAAGFSIIEWNVETGSPGDALALAGHARALGIHGILADDYRIGIAWLDWLNGQGWTPMLFDDYGRLSTYSACRGVINFGVAAARPEYPGLPADRLLYGPRYFPARRELAAVRVKSSGRAEQQDVNKVLVTLGGRDRHGILWPLLRALSRVAPKAAIRAIVPPDVIRSTQANPVQDRLVATTPFMADHFAWADACISGGGLTKYECAYIGLPVAIIPQTDAEQAETRFFAAEGLGYDLGTSTRVDELEEMLEPFVHRPDLRRGLTQNGHDRFRLDSPVVVARAVLSWTDERRIPSLKREPDLLEER
jgi:spore coat polysaccharide biosynthesis predicted glycosyltransferase SpsG